MRIVGSVRQVGSSASSREPCGLPSIFLPCACCTGERLAREFLERSRGFDRQRGGCRRCPNIFVNGRVYAGGGLASPTSWLLENYLLQDRLRKEAVKICRGGDPIVYLRWFADL